MTENVNVVGDVIDDLDIYSLGKERLSLYDVLPQGVYTILLLGSYS